MTGLNQVDSFIPYTVQGMRLQYGSATTLTVKAGTCRSQDNTNNLVMSTDLVLNTAVKGIGGLDTGTMANNSLYYIYVVGSSLQAEPVGVICALANNAVYPDVQTPAWPFNYDVCFRVGAFLTNGSAQILPFTQRGNSTAPWMFYNTPIQIVTTGHGTTTTAVSLAGLIPPRATLIEVIGSITPNSAGNSISIGTPPTTFAIGSVASVAAGSTGIVASSEPFPTNVNYLVSNASDDANVYLVGYQDLLVA